MKIYGVDDIALAREGTIRPVHCDKPHWRTWCQQLDHGLSFYNLLSILSAQ